MRLPCGAPVTLLHVPRLPPTSHAWHELPHAPSQQYPSTQMPDVHSCAPVAQVLPFAFFATQFVPLHQLPATHPASVEHVVGQVAPIPWHKYTPHVVRLPWGAPVTLVHVPKLPETSQASHELPHVALQQYPSTQLPELHSCAPVGHVLPFAFFTLHLLTLHQ